MSSIAQAHLASSYNTPSISGVRNVFGRSWPAPFFIQNASSNLVRLCEGPIVKLIFEDGSRGSWLYFHGDLLRQHSRYFRACFNPSYGFKESQTGELHLPYEDQRHFKILWDCLYGFDLSNSAKKSNYKFSDFHEHTSDDKSPVQGSLALHSRLR